MTITQDIQPAAQRLCAENLACRRGGRMVFEGLGFNVDPGDYLHLVGSNGSGKSTLLRVIAGLIPPTSGMINYGDLVVEGASLAENGLLLYAGHQNGLKPVWTLRKNCETFVGIMTGKAITEEHLYRALKGLGLENFLDLPVRFFSSGQLHRASLLRFLLIERPVWLMDEPTVGLDSENRQLLEGIMQNHLKKGGSIIAASHDPINIQGGALTLTDFTPRNRELEDWV